nr:LOW QUALITY PROTEIN: uncharacterized protein LOC113804390 [Penaeus vannamei]
MGSWGLRYDHQVRSGTTTRYDTRYDTGSGTTGTTTGTTTRYDHRYDHQVRPQAQVQGTAGLSQLESAPAPADAKETPRKTKGVIPHLGHLPDLNKLSDVIRNLVMGNVVFVKPILKPRKICIYTCADLKDTIMERSALMEHVYPKLRLYCMEKGYELNIVDLHWGIPDEHLNDHSFKELCLGQLTTQARDSHIVTVVFLNETFGNALLPRVIEGPDFDQAISAMEHDTEPRALLEVVPLGRERDRPATSCSHQHASSGRYHWDENAQKRSPSATGTTGRERAAALLQAADSNSASLHQEAVQDWNNEVKKMMTLMRMVFNQEQKEKYLSTVMEQEIKQSVFMNQESAKHCLWICRSSPTSPSPQQSPRRKERCTWPSGTRSKKRLTSPAPERTQAQARDSHIVTVVFLNETFGNALLPRVIEGPDFDQAISAMEHDTDRELFWKWYHWDENAQPPCYKLQPISTYIPNIKDSNSQPTPGGRAGLEQRGQEDDDADEDVFQSGTERRPSIMEQGLIRKGLDCVLLGYQAERLHEPGEPNTAVISASSPLPSHNIAGARKCVLQLNPSSKKLDILQSELKCGATPVLEDLLRLNLAAAHPINRRAHRGGRTKGRQELLTKIMRVARSCSQDQEVELRAGCEEARGLPERCVTKIRTVPQQRLLRALIMHGEVGCGKSSLIAKAMERCCEWLVDVPSSSGAVVGLPPGSSTTEQVLRPSPSSAARSLETIAEASKSVRHMSAFLKHVWSKACKIRPLVIMIDGIDQVKCYGSTSLEWLPSELPENVKLIMRSAPDDRRRLQQVRGILSSTTGASTRRAEGLVSKYLQECPLPLYVEIMGRMACQWTGAETQLPLQPNLMGLINAVFDELEAAYGQVEVSHTLGYLTAAKHGLSDSEMIDILSCDEAVLEKIFVHCTPPVRRCPSLLWVQISKQVQPFLMKTIVAGICLFTWRHESFRDAAHARYLGTPDQINMCCTALIDYFQSKWANGAKKPVPVYEAGVEEGKDRYVLDQPTKYRGSNMSKISVQSLFSRHNRRKLDELPYQVLQLRGRILEEFVLKFDWVYEKLCGSDTYQVLEDVSLALRNHSNNIELVLLKEVLEARRLRPRIRRKAVLLAGVRALSTLMSDPAEPRDVPHHQGAVRHRRPRARALPAALTVCFHEPFQDQNMKLGDGQVYFNALIRARHNPHYVITLSTERGEIAVWNVFTMSPVRTLTGITQPRKLKMIDDYRCLVLCGRELRIYNFDEGLFVMKLREVMNQKMPFFGLHDKDHVVALSRSRMYVNMMNLQNGDCVATFKVGEDRFLNSLMVSENGKICVCGDETQKPSALLVWDLELRKLMYDLRIPHHEFITRLAAITKEGHYVSCVCREVDEPAPNFIVVYDLQSGTLFKKWKPGVNIISIAISSAGGCVVVGLEDSKLMAYDLITGNPRWTLKGHTAPPNTIRLDNRGLQCLTFDSLGRDRSVRVWDIHTGNSLAVLTPDQAITACEISSDGKAVVMALEGRNEIVTFLLCHQTGVDERPTPKSYGNDTNRGKVFDLSQAGTWPMSGDAEENMLWS